jgi:hypothetical protein
VPVEEVKEDGPIDPVEEKRLAPGRTSNQIKEEEPAEKKECEEQKL